MDGIDPGSWGEIIIGIFALVLSVFIFFWSRRRPKISYLIETKKIIYVQDVSLGDLTISFKGNPITSLAICSIRIKNTGNFPVKVEDWQKPLEIAFPQENKILDAKISAKSTDDLDVEFSIEQQRTIKISAALLNQKDGFALDVLVEKEARPKISARVFDIEKLDEIDPEKRSISFLKLYLIASVGLILFPLIFFFEIPKPFDAYASFAIIATAISPIFIIIAANVFDLEKKMKI